MKSREVGSNPIPTKKYWSTQRLDYKLGRALKSFFYLCDTTITNKLKSSMTRNLTDQNAGTRETLRKGKGEH